MVLWDTTIRKWGTLDWAAEVDLHYSGNWKLSCWYAKFGIWQKFYSCNYLTNGRWPSFLCIKLSLSVGSSWAIGFLVTKGNPQWGHSCEISALIFPEAYVCLDFESRFRVEWYSIHHSRLKTLKNKQGWRKGQCRGSIFQIIP